MMDLLRALREDLAEPTQDSTVEIDWGGAERLGATHQRGESGAHTQSESSAPAAEITLHPEARRNFDAKADALLTMLSLVPPDPEGSTESDDMGERAHVVTELPPHARPGRTLLFRDGEGAPVARVYRHGATEVGLQGTGYRELRTLAERMQGTRDLRSVITVEMLERLIFEWLGERFVGATTTPMTDAVLARIAMLFAEYEVVIPLYRVEIEAPLQFGRVALRSITAGDFNRWMVAAGPPSNPAVAAQLRIAMQQERRRMQGFAAAVLTLRGEKRRVLQMALDEAEKTSAMLRLFSPAMLSPVARSYCAPWGRQGIDTPSYLLLNQSHPGLEIGSYLEIKEDFTWRLSAERICLIREQALDGLNQNLVDGTPTAFAEEIRTALILYSQCALRRTAVDKLLTILLPFESFLLRSQTESITENIAMRFAWATGATGVERRRMRTVAQEVYAMRSRYLHHRTPIEGLEQLETLREFMEYVWRFFMKLGLDVVSTYPDRAAYLADLDDRRLG